MSEETVSHPIVEMIQGLRNQIAQLTKERDELKAQLKAWESNATYSINMGVALSTEKLQKEHDALRTRAEAAEAKCAEMRDVIRQVTTNTPLSERLVVMANHALSDQCGVGWLSPEKKKVLVEALESIRDPSTDHFAERMAKQALESIK